MGIETSDVLAQLCGWAREAVAERRAALPLRELKLRLRDAADEPRGFTAALQRKTAERQVGLIAEIKRASPSAGVIRPEFEPAAIARAYEAAGAACLSVLTEARAFRGEVWHLEAARAATRLPVLRKDFIIDAWQLYESRLMGADCVLLILSALVDAQAAEFAALARSLDLDVLVEVHDASELERALALPCSLIGINNRNLRTLKTELATTLELAPLVPPDRIVVAESGIATRADVERLAAYGASGFLVGESLLRQPDCGLAAAALLGPLG